MKYSGTCMSWADWSFELRDHEEIYHIRRDYEEFNHILREVQILK